MSVSKSGKHTPYFELLEAQSQAGCPICRLVYKATDRYLDSLLYEAVLDPQVRMKVKAAQGFCAVHVEMLGRRPGRALGIALIYRDIIRDTAAQAAKITSGNVKPGLWNKGKLGQQLARLLRTKQVCPACQIGAEAEHNYITLMVEYIEDSEFQTAYAQGEGLCLPHLLAGLESCTTIDEVQNLVNPQLERYQLMLHELDEFIRKRDHRFRHEAMGDEGDVWLRAMNALVGGAGWGLSARSGGRRSEPGDS